MSEGKQKDVEGTEESLLEIKDVTSVQVMLVDVPLNESNSKPATSTVEENDKKESDNEIETGEDKKMAQKLFEGSIQEEVDVWFRDERNK